jgi:2-phosphosulfolactate phosphatase
VKRCDFADFGNSPFDYTAEQVSGEDLVFTTTNGTKAVTIARHAFRVVAGAFINLQAVADYCLTHGRDVVVLASAWEDKVNIEDSLFGGALTEALLHSGAYQVASDAGRIALEMWQTHKHQLRPYIEQSDHFARLQANHLADSVDYCLSLNLSSAVPEINAEGGQLSFCLPK